MGKLLGIFSRKGGQNHYAPWVQSRQIAFEEDLQRTWGMKRY